MNLSELQRFIDEIPENCEVRIVTYNTNDKNKDSVIMSEVYNTTYSFRDDILTIYSRTSKVKNN